MNESSSHVNDVRSSLILKLKSARDEHRIENLSAVLMNDFSLDRLVHVDDLEHFLCNVKDIYARKGGIYARSYQTNQQGGCAANCCTTLGKLGVQTYFICRTNGLGKSLISYYLNEKAGVDVSHVKLGGRLATMTALEIGESKINIMINDLDSFTPFGFDDLDEDDLDIIERSDLVGVFDWCLNRKGTELANGIFDFAYTRGIPTYFDTSDPSPLKDKIPDLFSRALSHPGLAYLSLNENELHQYAGCEMQAETRLMEIQETSKKLKSKIHADLQVHTELFSASVGDSAVHVMPTYDVHPLRTTGAGDNWNAGNILGILLKIEPEERLLLANSTAGFYITSEESSRPTLDELIMFLEDQNNKFHDIF